MTGTTYEQYKEKTLEQHRIFLDTLQSLPEEQLKQGVNLELLALKAQNIKNNKFTLMVVGEAKSGKSTFINAYLKTDVLPMSVAQCTSAIIEISYADELSLAYYTGDGSKYVIKEHKAIRDFLESHAALNENYRKIPVPSLNDLLVHRKGNIPPAIVRKAQEDYKDDNLYLPQDEYDRCIEQYLNEKKSQWEKIVVKIEIQCNFSSEMKNVRIIDSPGVNALGGVGEITETYIKNADAVVFIKALSGQALESKSFHSFLRTKNANRHPETLFLFLSRAGDLKPSDRESQVSDARMMYGSRIMKDKIILIDSQIQYELNRFKGMNEHEIDSIVTEEGEKGIGNDKIFRSWMLKHSVDDFFKDMEALSGFQNINNLFEKYAKKAHFIALNDMLGELNRSYDVVLARLRQAAVLKREKMEKTPEELAEMIRKIKENLDSLEKELHTTLYRIQKDYTEDEKGIIFRKRDELLRQAKSVLESSPDYTSLETEITKITDPLAKLKEQCLKDLLEACNDSLRAKCNEKEFPTWQDDILVPGIPSEEVKKLIEESEEKTKEKKEPSSTFDDPKYVVNKKKCHELVKASITNRLDQIAGKAIGEMITSIGSIIETYGKKLSAIIKEEKKIYDGYVEDKKTADLLAKDIDTITNHLIPDAVTKQSNLNMRKTEVEHAIRG